MGISPKDVGRRLRQVRKYHNMTQKFVAESVGFPQNAVSRLECGRDLSSEKLVLFLKFYSQYVNIDIIFDERFDMLLTGDKQVSKSRYIGSILEEKINLLREIVENNNKAVNQELENLMRLAQINK